MKHIVLSPHFDDAILSLGGLLHKHAQDASVVTFFAGKPTKKRTTMWDLGSGFANSDKAIEARIQEDRTALHSLGVSSYIHLPYLDDQYRKEEPAKKEILDSLGAAVIEIVGDSDEEVRVYGPGLEIHPDHRLIKEVFTQYAGTRKEPCRYFHYQDIPYAISLLKSSPKDFTALQEKIPGSIHEIGLSENDMDKKVEAIRKYASQLAPLGGEKRLTKRIKEFSHNQARSLGSAAPHVEVVYEI